MTPTQTLEYLAVATGLWSVWLSKKEHIGVYPTGIVSVVIYVYLCSVGKLYAEAAINFYYLIMSIYGWFNWSRHKNSNQTTLQITACTPLQNLVLVCVTAAIWLGIAAFLRQFTDSTVPYSDGLATAIFFVGMWLMATKKIENWIYWILGDLICIPLYYQKGYTATSLQYIAFTAIAVAGFFSWQKKLLKAR